MTAYDDLIAARTPRLYLPLHTNALSAVGPNPTTTDFVGGQEFVTGPEAFGNATRFRSADTEELRISSTLLSFNFLPHTIECWFRRSGNPAAQGTIYRWNSRGTTLKVTTGGLLRASWFNNSGTETAISRAENICDGFWHYLMAMWTEDGTWYTVIDGDSTGSHGSGVSAAFLSSQASIGSSLTTEFLDAEVCGFAVYNSAIYYDSTDDDLTVGVEARAAATYYAGLRDLNDRFDEEPTRARITVRDEERSGRIPVASRTLNPVFEPDVRVTETTLNLGDDYVEKLLRVDDDRFFGFVASTTQISVYVLSVDANGVTSLDDTIILLISDVSTALGGASVIVQYRDYVWWNDRLWIRLSVGPFGSNAEPIMAAWDWDGTDLTFFGAWRPVQGDPNPHMWRNSGEALVALDDDWVLCIGEPGASFNFNNAVALQAMLFQFVPGGPTVDGFGPFSLSTDAGRVPQQLSQFTMLAEDGSVVVNAEMFSDTGEFATGHQMVVLAPDTGTPTVTRFTTARRPPPHDRVLSRGRGLTRRIVDLGGGRCVFTVMDGPFEYGDIGSAETQGLIGVYRYDDGTFDLPLQVLRSGGSSNIVPGIIPGHEAVIVVVMNMTFTDPDFGFPWEEGTLAWFIVSFDENGFMHEWGDRDAAVGQRLDWFEEGGTVQLSDTRAVTYVAVDINAYDEAVNIFFVVDS